MSSSVAEIGNVGINHEEMRIDWKITDFFPIVKDTNYPSPDFFFVDDSWYLNLCLNEYLDIELCCDKEREYPVEYNYGIKNVDGTVEVVGKGIIQGDHYDTTDPVEPSELDRRKSELVPSGVLTITCTMKYVNPKSDQSNALNKPKFSKFIKLDTLSENFKSLFANKDTCDTILYVGDKEYKAHRAVLIARSPIFAAMFQHDTEEKQTGTVKISDCDAESFEEFLKFLYCGMMEEPSSRNALNLYQTSDKYEVLELKAFCVEYLKQNVTVENVCDVVIMAEKYDEEDLMSAAQSFFNKNRDEIFDTSEWDNLMQKDYRLVKKLLKQMSSKIKLIE